MDALRIDPVALAERLKLQRPLLFYDLETTGTSIEMDHVVEVAVVKLHPGGTLTQGRQRFKPPIPIPPESSAIHGIWDRDVADCPPFGSKARAIAKSFSGCDIGGHNIRGFDNRMLLREMERAGVPFSLEGARVIDTKMILFQKHPRDLNAALGIYVGPEAQAEHRAVAHSALGDVLGGVAVLAGQLAAHPDLPVTIDELHAFCAGSRGDRVDEEGKLVWRYRKAAIGFGKHAGRSLADIVQNAPDYLEWMLKGDFPADTKAIIRRALAGQFPEAPPLDAQPGEEPQ